MESGCEFTLELKPSTRIDVIDVQDRFRESFGDCLKGFRKALYYSYHTTAGYFEETLCARLDHDPDLVRRFVDSYHRLFPPGANYFHDQLHLRKELSEIQRRNEPRNADSHLTFIGSGLTNCATYTVRNGRPVYFVDLDGVFGETVRTRRTSVIPYNFERRVDSLEAEIGVSNHSVVSVNLNDQRLGLMERIRERIARSGVRRGRVDIVLAPSERNAGLTVNEYETLLMRHDLVDVLRNPFRFMAERWRHALQNPRAVPGKMLNYAKYDLVQVVNQLVDALRLRDTLAEKALDKFLGVPAERFLRMKRSVSLMISGEGRNGGGTIVEGTYQSPILIQWQRSEARSRRLLLDFIQFE